MGTLLENLKGLLDSGEAHPIVVTGPRDKHRIREVEDNWYYRQPGKDPRTGIRTDSLHSDGSAEVHIVKPKGRGVWKLIFTRKKGITDFIGALEAHPPSNPSGRHRGSVR